VALPEPEVAKPVRKPAELPTDHAQPVGAVTVKLPEPDADPTLAVAPETSIVQTLAWSTVTVWPATVAVPLRAAPVFAASVSVTVADPLPLAGLGVMKPLAELAVHGQLPLLIVSATLDVCELPEAVMVLGLTPAVQPLAWLTTNVSVAPVSVAVAVSVALRAMSVFAATV
jgi:hypothetical protein